MILVFKPYSTSRDAPAKYQEKAKGQDTKNITTLMFHMDTRLQHDLVTVFKMQPKKANYLHTELSRFE